MAEVQWRQTAFHAYPAQLVAQPFKWSSDGVILLDVTIQGHPAKGIYDPGCVGIALSQAWAARHAIPGGREVPLTISSADGVSTISRTVYDAVEVVWKQTRASLPAVVLPGVGFDVLLGMSWIVTAGVSLDATTRTIRHKGQEYSYKQLSIPPPPTEVLSAALYARRGVYHPATVQLQAAPGPF